MPDPDPLPLSGRDRASLRADCESCFALCCVALCFHASADFAIDKTPDHSNSKARATDVMALLRWVTLGVRATSGVACVEP